MKVCMVAVINISTSIQFHIFRAPYVFSSSLFDGGVTWFLTKLVAVLALSKHLW